MTLLMSHVETRKQSPPTCESPLTPHTPLLYLYFALIQNCCKFFYLAAECCWYSLSDSSLAIAFSIFFVTKRSSFPSKLGKYPRSTTTCMYKLTFCLNILLIIMSPCKICPLPTIPSRESVLFATDKHARLYCRQCAHFTTGTNEQNQHFAVLRLKVSSYIYVVVLQSGLPSLDGKLES